MLYLIHAFAVYTAPLGSLMIGRYGYYTDKLPPRNVPPECCYKNRRAALRAAEMLGRLWQGKYICDVIQVPDEALKASDGR